MHEKVERPEMLIGSTYKIKTPVSDHAMYVTINDIVLNEGTPNEQRRPFEIFINSKNLDHFQWIVALTRIISAVFRKGGDVTFLVEEMKAVFDPRGGYWQSGGKFMPSIIAELGYVIEKHLQMIGLLKAPEMDERAQEAHRGEEGGVRSAQQADGCVREEPLPGRRAAVREVQHRGRRDDGRLHDVPELRATPSAGEACPGRASRAARAARKASASRRSCSGAEQDAFTPSGCLPAIRRKPESTVTVRAPSFGSNSVRGRKRHHRLEDPVLVRLAAQLPRRTINKSSWSARIVTTVASLRDLLTTGLHGSYEVMRGWLALLQKCGCG